MDAHIFFLDINGGIMSLITFILRDNYLHIGIYFDRILEKGIFIWLNPVCVSGYLSLFI